jgi:hypothetical protein
MMSFVYTQYHTLYGYAKSYFAECHYAECHCTMRQFNAYFSLQTLENHFEIRLH